MNRKWSPNCFFCFIILFFPRAVFLFSLVFGFSMLSFCLLFPLLKLKHLYSREWERRRISTYRSKGRAWTVRAGFLWYNYWDSLPGTERQSLPEGCSWGVSSRPHQSEKGRIFAIVRIYIYVYIHMYLHMRMRACVCVCVCVCV